MELESVKAIWLLRSNWNFGLNGMDRFKCINKVEYHNKKG
jgi:hypothetical protein